MLKNGINRTAGFFEFRQILKLLQRQSFLKYLNVHLILSSNITGPADLPNKLKCNLYALCITIFINPQLSSPSQFASTSYPIHRQTLANSLKRLLN